MGCEGPEPNEGGVPEGGIPNQQVQVAVTVRDCGRPPLAFVLFCFKGFPM